MGNCNFNNDLVDAKKINGNSNERNPLMKDEGI